MFDLTNYRLIDLTHSYRPGMAGFRSTIFKTVERDGWNARQLELYSHAGTHMDAPYHFGVSEETIDEYPPDRLLGRAWVARLSITAPRQLLEVADLGAVARRVEPGDGLLLHTGWSRHIGEAAYRRDLPRIGRGLAEWCVERRITLLGVEPPSVADVNDLAEVTEIHRILLSGRVIIVEGLTNLDQIHGDRVFLIALPLKIQGGDGAPARVLALEPTKS